MDNNRRDAEQALTYIASVVVLVTIGVLFWFVHLLFFVFAAVTFISLLAVVADFGLRRVTRYEYHHIGEHGSVGVGLLGKVKSFRPLSGVAAAGAEKKAALPAIPTLAQMLAQELLGSAIMYFGYQINASNELVPLTGMFNDVRTFAILGKGGVGKTVRLFFILIQCLLSNAEIYLCDPHLTKPGSITKLLAPLSDRIRFAVTDPKGDIESQVMAMVSAFKERMERRVHDQEEDRTPCVLVIDEFNRMVGNEEYGEACVEVVVSCANEYRDFGGYSVLAMHEVTANGKRKVQILLAKLRRALHSIFVMRVDRDYAKYFLDGKPLRQVPHLKTGMSYFIDTDGQVHADVYTPRGTVADAFTVARQLKQLEGPKQYDALSAPVPRQYDRMDIEEEYAPELVRVAPLRLMPAQEDDPRERAVKREEVKRLRAEGNTQTEIIRRVWAASPGNTKAYKDALSEYKSILEWIARGEMENE